MNSGYIHINQAVKKYNKTRQTFYNYINKGYVNTKKVNNKIFLKIEDIEKILNDYIELDEAKESTPETIYESAPIQETIHVNRNHEPDKKLNQKGIIDSMGNMLQQIEESILRSSKGQLYTNQQVLQGLITEKQTSVLSKINELSHTLRKNSKRQRKTLFWMYYLVFVSINVFVLRYIG